MPRPRTLSPEVLDHLPADDPRARRSRRDLRRVNAVMGNGRILMRGLRDVGGPRDVRGLRAAPAPLRVLELGAGDGSLMLHIARRMADRWPRVQLQLLDRIALLDEATRAAFERLGWSVQPLVIDLLDWIGAPGNPGHWDVIVANLFLHHFEASQLQRLFAALAERCERFVACEPRRGADALLASRLIGLIGANDVTRNDALLSVKAGFRDAELSALWGASGWALQEQAAGLFSHFFAAGRRAMSEPR